VVAGLQGPMQAELRLELQSPEPLLGKIKCPGVQQGPHQNKQ